MGSLAAESSKAASSRKFHAPAREIIRTLSVEDAYRLTKAFAIYFELTNLAETNHRKRRRRAANLEPTRAVVEGSFRGTLKRMRACRFATGTICDGTATGLRNTGVHGAPDRDHETHSTPEASQHRGGTLERLDQLPLAHTEAAELESQIMAEITSLWQTDEVRLKRPTVQDEVYMGLDYFQMVLFDTLPRLYANWRMLFKRSIPRLDRLRNRRTFPRFPSCCVRFVDRWRSRWQSVRNGAIDARRSANGATGSVRSLHRRTVAIDHDN